MVKEYVTGTVGKEMGSVPFGDMIKNIALGIAEGQLALDRSSMQVAEFMSGQKVLYNDALKYVNADGVELPEDAPPVVHDSRIYFGYDHEFKGINASATIEIKEGAISLKQSDQQKGSDYDYPPTVEIVGDGTGAIVTVKLKDGKVTLSTKAGGVGTGYSEARLVVTGGKIPKRVPRLVSMMELGFAPNFYQFVETVIEIKIVVNMVEEQTESKGETPRTQIDASSSDTSYSRSSAQYNWWRGYSYSGTHYRKRTSQVSMTKSVDPAMTSKYNYSIEGSSSVRTRLVPIPPPAVLEERVRALIDLDREYQDLQRGRSGAAATQS